MKYAHRTQHPDGGLSLVTHDLQWDFTSPAGKHSRGVAASMPEALAAIEEARKADIVGRWSRGTIGNDGTYHVPLD